MALTQLQITKLKPTDKRLELADGHGLYLTVQPASGFKSWCLRYRRPGVGTSAKLTLGPFRLLGPGEREPADAPTLGSPLTLKQARVLATAEQQKIGQGQDPAAQRQSAKQADVVAKADDRDHFDVVARKFLERYARRHQRASTFAETCNLLGFVQAADGKLALRNADADRKHSRPLSTWPATGWAGRKVHAIGRRDIIDLLESIVDAGSPAASNSTQAALSKLFAWTVEEDILPSSPALGVKKRAPLVRRDRVLSDSELRLILAAAAADRGPFGRLIELLSLTGARLQEWGEARWSEIDLAERIFHLPASRSKNGRAHDLPLSPQAIAVLGEAAKLRIEGSDWVFSSGMGRKGALVAFSGFSKAKDRLDKVAHEIACREIHEAGGDPASVQPMAAWRLHDLRRTTSTGLARLRIAKEVNEKVLNHASGSFGGVGGTYDRHGYADEMRDALERWGSAVERIGQGEPFMPSNVIALKVPAQG